MGEGQEEMGTRVAEREIGATINAETMGSASRLHDSKGIEHAERLPGAALDEGRPRTI